MIDWNQVGLLLHIVEKGVGHPQLKGLTNAALAELAKHNEEALGLKKQPASIMPGHVTRIKEQEEPQTANAEGPVRRREVPEEVA